MNSGKYNNLVTSIKKTALALFWGGIFGLTGVFFCFWLPAVPLSTALIFGGMGMIICLGPEIPLLLPVIHCAYALVIIHFRLKGIICVILIHYSLTVFMLVIWIMLDFSPDMREGFREYFYPVYRDPSMGIVLHVALLMTIISATLYNGFLLSLLSAKVRKKLSLEDSSCQG